MPSTVNAASLSSSQSLGWTGAQMSLASAGVWKVNATTELQFFINNSGVFRMSGTSLRPWSPGGVGLGSAAIPWGDFHIKPSASVTPTVNGALTIEATSNTSVTIKLKGSDGTVRTNVLTMS